MNFFSRSPKRSLVLLHPFIWSWRLLFSLIRSRRLVTLHCETSRRSHTLPRRSNTKSSTETTFKLLQSWPKQVLLHTPSKEKENNDGSKIEDESRYRERFGRRKYKSTCIATRNWLIFKGFGSRNANKRKRKQVR